MHRIDGPGATVDNKFTEGDPVSGVEATTVTDDWLNDVQEEIISVLSASSVTPVKGTQDQLLTAIKKIVQKGGHGQCRLSVASANSMVLMPYNGNSIVIDGAVRNIPQAGVSASSAGLSAATAYYVYAYMNGANIALEFSTTGHSAAENGVRTKTGDTSRTLVGWTQTNPSGQFALDTASTISTMNWFNRRVRTVSINSTSEYTFSNTTLQEINSALRVYIPTWQDGVVTADVHGNFFNSVSGAGVNIQLYALGYGLGTRLSSNIQSNTYCPFCSIGGYTHGSDGLTFFQLYASVGSGIGSITNGVQLHASVLI